MVGLLPGGCSPRTAKTRGRSEAGRCTSAKEGESPICPHVAGGQGSTATSLGTVPGSDCDPQGRWGLKLGRAWRQETERNERAIIAVGPAKLAWLLLHHLVGEAEKCTNRCHKQLAQGAHAIAA